MDRSVRRVVCALAKYASINPNSSDTCEGIHRWWLQDDEASEEDVAMALHWLVRKGIFERLPAADGRIRYRRSAPADVLQHLLNVCANRDDGAL